MYVCIAETPWGPGPLGHSFVGPKGPGPIGPILGESFEEVIVFSQFQSNSIIFNQKHILSTFWKIIFLK